LHPRDALRDGLNRFLDSCDSLAAQGHLGVTPRSTARAHGGFGLSDAGVARRSSRGTLIDTFQNRIIFGIRDRDGCVAGFTGRDLSGGPGASTYLNPLQSRLFDKGSCTASMRDGS
jgi:DNA primase